MNELDHRTGSLFRQAKAVTALSWGSGDLRLDSTLRAKFVVDLKQGARPFVPQFPICVAEVRMRGAGDGCAGGSWRLVRVSPGVGSPGALRASVPHVRGVNNSFFLLPGV